MLQKYCQVMLKPNKLTILKLLHYIKYLLKQWILDPIELLLLNVRFCGQISLKYFKVQWYPYRKEGIRTVWKCQSLRHSSRKLPRAQREGLSQSKWPSVETAAGQSTRQKRGRGHRWTKFCCNAVLLGCTWVINYTFLSKCLI